MGLAPLVPVERGLEPLLVELLRCFIAQGLPRSLDGTERGLVRPHLLVDPDPSRGQEGSLSAYPYPSRGKADEPTQIGGQLLHLVELLFVGVPGRCPGDS